MAIAIVTSGTFQYRASGSNGREMMTPGSLLLGSPGQCFECGHEHGVGDRCLSFRFTPEYFEAIAARSGAAGGRRTFRSLRLPPVRTLSPVIADACAALTGSTDIAWEELGIRLAARTVQVDGDIEPDRRPISPAALARVTRTVRLIQAQPATELTLVQLAREARLSPFHYLRTFESLTGVTPHQYLVRARLRAAAARLITATDKSSMSRSTRDSATSRTSTAPSGTNSASAPRLPSASTMKCIHRGALPATKGTIPCRRAPIGLPAFFTKASGIHR